MMGKVRAERAPLLVVNVAVKARVRHISLVEASNQDKQHPQGSLVSLVPA